MVRENIYNKKIPKYSSVNSILKHFNIREKQLENLLQEMEKNQRLAYTYYYGINRPKLDLEDISEMLHVSENVVKIYINQADDFIQRFCQNITAPIPGVVENKGRRTKNKKISFFDYFDEKDKPLILEIIEEYKEKNLDYYEILVKACGEKYDCLVLSALTKEEKIKLNNFRAIIKNKIKNGNFSKKPSLTKKQSFFDYFDEKDKDFALEIIEDYKKIDHVYYKVLVKEFGKNYDHLVEPSLLTDLEKIYLENFRIDIVHKIHEKKATLVSNQKQSFFDYFDQKDYDSVLKIIEEYKKLNHEDYKLLVREYGEHYDCLVVPSPLNDKEKIQLSNFKMTIKEKLQNDNLSINSVKNETQNLQDKNFNCNLSMSYIYRRFPNLKQEKESDLIILTSFIDRKKSVESISNLTKFSIKKIDFTLLKHTPLKLNNLYNLLCFPFLFLDELLLFLFIPTKKINKFSLILMIVGTIVFSTGLIFECYLFFTPKYFENSKYPYLIKYFAYRNNHYLEHLDILYLICTTAFIIFHFSTQCEIARIIFKGKRNSIITLIFPTVLAIGVIFNYKLNMTKEVASLILMITTIILTLFFILFKFARRKKHATNN